MRTVHPCVSAPQCMQDRTLTALDLSGNFLNHNSALVIEDLGACYRVVAGSDPRRAPSSNMV
eukprot:6475863-Amphidinium_carterae.2